MLKERLLPQACLVTPNLREAEALTGRIVDKGDEMEDVSRAILDLGVGAVLLKGVGLNDEEALDLFFDGSNCTRLVAPRHATRSIHGTGCTLSAAITAFLALGEELVDAVRHAKSYLGRAIRNAPELGSGYGPLGHSV